MRLFALSFSAMLNRSKLLSLAKLRSVYPAAFISSVQQHPVTAEVRKEIDSCYNRLDLKFVNGQEAFRSKTNFNLLRGYVVLKLLNIKWLVVNNQRIMAASKRILGKNIFRRSMKLFIYGHFVAGETPQEIKPKVEVMRKFGVKSILDYSAEADLSHDAAKKLKFGDRRVGVHSARTYFYADEEQCDQNLQNFLDSIDITAETTEGTGLAAIKLTALGRPSFLMRLSHVISQTQNFYSLLTGGKTWEELVFSKLSQEQFLERLKEYGVKVDSAEVKNWFAQADFNADGFVDIYEWGRLIDSGFKLGQLFKVLDLKTGKMVSLLPNLSEEEEIQFANMMKRLNTIAERAAEKNIRVMIDAEQTYFQPAISRLTLELMRRYNKERPVFFNTYQCYLKNALNYLLIDLHMAEREDFYFGAKLVRGAYMDQERNRAAQLGYEDPINPNFETTTKMYQDIFRRIMAEVHKRPLGKVSMMIATHNEETVRFAVNQMKENCIAPSAKIVCFGQLYGMCDQISYPLGQAGYSVYKYVPYGPVDEVLPYISRRAVENSSLTGKSGKEVSMMAAELKRRFLAGQWFYRPVPPAFTAVAH